MCGVLHPKPSQRLSPSTYDFGLPVEDALEAFERPAGPAFEPRDQAERIVVRFLRLCEHPLTRKRTLGLISSILEGDETGTRVIWLVNLMTGSRLAGGENVQAALMRRQLVGVILAGLGAGRYVRRVEPVASATEEQIVELVAPSIRAALEKPDPAPRETARVAEVVEVAEVPRHRREPEYESWLDDFDQTMVLPLDR